MVLLGNLRVDFMHKGLAILFFKVFKAKVVSGSAGEVMSKNTIKCRPPKGPDEGKGLGQKLLGDGKLKPFGNLSNELDDNRSCSFFNLLENGLLAVSGQKVKGLFHKSGKT